MQWRRVANIWNIEISLVEIEALVQTFPINLNGNWSIIQNQNRFGTFNSTWRSIKSSWASPCSPFWWSWFSLSVPLIPSTVREISVQTHAERRLSQKLIAYLATARRATAKETTDETHRHRQILTASSSPRVPHSVEWESNNEIIYQRNIITL